VAGLFIEDQIFPKRCGHMEGKQVIPVPEMVAKIRAATDAKKASDFVIMARTDALAVHGIEEAVSRANIYHNAGADLIFVEAPESVEQMKRICTEVNAPLFANNLPGGKTPLLTAGELQEIGYSVVADGVSCTYVIAKAVTDFFTELNRTGSWASFSDRMIMFDEFNQLVGLEEIRAREREYYSSCL
jgi:methylisocitrate lyase